MDMSAPPLPHTHPGNTHGLVMDAYPGPSPPPPPPDAPYSLVGGGGGGHQRVGWGAWDGARGLGFRVYCVSAPPPCLRLPAPNQPMQVPCPIEPDEQGECADATALMVRSHFTVYSVQCTVYSLQFILRSLGAWDWASAPKRPPSWCAFSQRGSPSSAAQMHPGPLCSDRGQSCDAKVWKSNA
jgi:hypothetical protein